MRRFCFTKLTCMLSSKLFRFQWHQVGKGSFGWCFLFFQFGSHPLFHRIIHNKTEIFKINCYVLFCNPLHILTSSERTKDFKAWLYFWQVFSIALSVFNFWRWSMCRGARLSIWLCRTILCRVHKPLWSKWRSFPKVLRRSTLCLHGKRRRAYLQPNLWSAASVPRLTEHLLW